ncbi:DUF481 domain-containing protein [Alteromonas sediminis]|uniref:DUF481 domain-containing protein n=1 Tax=Alteromonas sediminis TaxID=2259342 RepID=UPI001404A370|nr:DUF481 domain-containing protein [Alteromonas sediminis]
MFSASAMGAGGREDIIKMLYAVDFSDSRNEGAEPGFALEGEFGFIMASGNTDATSVKGKLFATHETATWSNQYEVEGLYTRSQRINQDNAKRTTAQRVYASSHADYKLLNPEQRIFLFADYEDDRFSAFDYQASIATGWAHVKWRDNASSFRYSIGPGFNFSERKNGDGDDNSGFIVRASAEYLYKWTSGARLRQFFSTAAGDENTRSRSETSISANIFDALAMKLSLKLDHNTSPRLDDATLNTETSVALVYQFF